MTKITQHQYLKDLFERKAKEDQEAESLRLIQAKETIRSRRPHNEEALIEKMIQSITGYISIDTNEETNPFMELSEILCDFSLEEIEMIRPDIFHEFKLLLVCAVRCDWKYKEVSDIIRQSATESVERERAKKRRDEEKNARVLGKNYQF